MTANNYLFPRKIIELILILLPISLLFSNIISELMILILIIFYFKYSKFKELLNNIKEPIILLLLFFWLYLILNFLINFDNNPSFDRTFFFLRFPLLILSISFFINYLNINIKKIFSWWAIIIIIVCIDLVFQFFNQVNLVGYKAIPQGAIYRLGGFMDDELKISNLVYHFGTLVFSFFFSINFLKSNRNNFVSLLFLLLINLSIFITGERANFITISFFILLLLLFISFKNLKFFFTILSFIVIIFTSIYLSNSNISQRMINKLHIKTVNIFSTDTNKNFLYKNSHHFAHYSTAYQIFKDNKFFGVGLKNFRDFCDNEKFNAEIHPKWHKKKCAMHPHSYYFEILSETGLIGLIMLSIFFIFAFLSFLKLKNNYLIISSFILITYFIPLIPRGSFFTNWNAIIFWSIFAFVYSKYIELKKIR